MFLAWKLPPYYGSSNLYAFTKALRNFAKEEFTNDEMTFIQTQAKWVDEEVYFMVLDDLWKSTPEEQIEWKKSRKDIVELLKSLWVNDEVLWVEKVETKKTDFPKTIWFITPFDWEKDDTQEFIQSILDKNYEWWKIEVASLKSKNWRYLWDSIENFLNKYQVYLADVRNGNLNVALEIWYLLWDRKEEANVVFIVDDKEKISDIQWMIRVSKKDNWTKAWVTPEKASKKQQEINDKLEKDLKEQLDKFIWN